jgi:hypothetical protein
MTRFTSWSGIVHKTLSSLSPSFKLGHARELLAAGLGHKTYASLRLHDLAALESAEYVVLDLERLMQRAADIGVPLTLDQWWLTHRELTPGRITKGCYLGEASVMESAARHVFVESSHPLFYDIANRTGMSDGHWAHEAALLPGQDPVSDELAMLVHGEVQAFNEHDALATPVIAEVRFRRIGRQLYAEGYIAQVAQHGEPRPYEPIYEAEIYGP